MTHPASHAATQNEWRIPGSDRPPVCDPGRGAASRSLSAIPAPADVPNVPSVTAGGAYPVPGDHECWAGCIACQIEWERGVRS